MKKILLILLGLLLTSCGGSSNTTSPTTGSITPLKTTTGPVSNNPTSLPTSITIPSGTTPTPVILPPTIPTVTNSLITDSIFSATSFWYVKLPTITPIDHNSQNYVMEFLRQKKAYYGNVNININSYTSPVYFAPINATTVKVIQWDCQHQGYLDPTLESQWTAVPIPTYALQSPGTDAEMTIYQPSTDSMWEFWQAKQVNGQWQACWGGQMKNVSKSNGVWMGGFGTTATGLPFLGGQITSEELQRGEIKHVIGIALVDTENFNIFSSPAVRSDGYNPTKIPNRIPEGTRFRLDPTINLDSLNLNPTAKTIAKAAQIYGFVVWDKGGSISLRAENSLSYTLLGLSNPYTTLFNGIPSYNILNNFPWDKLQFLPKNYPN